MTSWTNPSNVRRIGSVSTTEFTDGQIEEFITLAQKEINSKIVTKVYREPVALIDSYRSNQINGLNTTFFVRNWLGKFLGDFDYDNDVNVSDVMVDIYDPSTQIETRYNPASIDIDACSFTMATAPNNVQMYVTYAYSSFDPINPDDFIAQCVAYLAGSYLFVGSDGFEIKFGNVTIKPGRDGGKGKQLYMKYNELLLQLNVNAIGGTLVANMETRI